MEVEHGPTLQSDGSLRLILVHQLRLQRYHLICNESMKALRRKYLDSRQSPNDGLQLVFPVTGQKGPPLKVLAGALVHRAINSASSMTLKLDQYWQHLLQKFNVITEGFKNNLLFTIARAAGGLAETPV